MKASQAYDKYLIKVEKNSVNDNISTDKGRFVKLYNEYQNRFVEYAYEKKNEDDYRYIQSLLTSTYIKPLLIESDHTLFKLPVDYFDLSNVSAMASKGQCVNKQLLLNEIKDFNVHLLISDDFYKPSFEYRESFYNLMSDAVKVYKSDFSVDSIDLSYYRYPKQVKLIFPDNPESGFDDSYELEFDDKVIDRVISASAGGFDLNESSERWQLHNLSSKTKL